MTVEVGFRILDSIGVELSQILHAPLVVYRRRSNILHFDIFHLHVTDFLIEVQLLLVNYDFGMDCEYDILPLRMNL